MGIVPYIIIIPLGAAFIIPVFGKRIKWAGGFLASLASLSVCIISFKMAFAVAGNKVLVYTFGNWLPQFGSAMVIDALSAFMLVVVNTVSFLAAVYSISYINKYTDSWKFFTLFSIMLAGINGVLAAGDIFNLYVFLEITAIAGYFLVAFGTEADEMEAAFKYAVMGAVASTFILLGIALLYSYTSTLNMADMARIISINGPSNIVKFVGVLFLMGFGLKASLAPFHAWLPYAHSSAPAPVSAMLSGVSIKVIGVYAIARIFFNVFGKYPEFLNILVVLGVISMIGGAILAFVQFDIKRVFAYSSISQIGYIALALGVATPLALIGGLFHLLNHSIFKSLLFLNAGAIEQIAGTRDARNVRGIVYKSPVTGYTGLIGALSISGMPPLGGFWSKLIIIIACIQAGRPMLGFIAALVSILTLAYYFKVLSPVLFGRAPGDDTKPAGRIYFSMGLSMIILAILSGVTVYMLIPTAGNMFNVLLKNAASVLADSTSYAAVVIGAFK